MPAEDSTWLIAVPNDGDAEGIRQELTAKIQQQSRTFSPNSLSEIAIPTFKVSNFIQAHIRGLKADSFFRQELSIY